MYRSLPPLSRAFSWLVAALLIGSGCRGAPEEGVEAAASPEPSIAQPVRRPEPAPLSVNPQRRKLDADGHLLESADEVRGFRLPMGVEPLRQTDAGMVLSIQTTMARLVRFYTSRGYHVVKGRKGYKVLHSNATLAGRDDAAEVKTVVAYLTPAVGRLKEIRIVETTAPAGSAAEEKQATERADMPAPAGSAATRERLRAWQKAHPGRRIVD